MRRGRGIEYESDFHPIHVHPDAYPRLASFELGLSRRILRNVLHRKINELAFLCLMLREQFLLRFPPSLPLFVSCSQIFQLAG